MTNYSALFKAAQTKLAPTIVAVEQGQLDRESFLAELLIFDLVTNVAKAEESSGATDFPRTQELLADWSKSDRQGMVYSAVQEALQIDRARHAGEFDPLRA